MCLYARLGRGEKALALIKRQLKPVGSECEGHDDGGGTYCNMLCAHPPFQIDGSLGITAGIAEMLLWNDGKVIRPLPALPAEWDCGEVTGLRLCGGGTADISWRNGKLAEIAVNGVSASADKINKNGVTLAGYTVIYDYNG